MKSESQHSMTYGDEKNGLPTVLQILPALQGGGVERGTLEMADAITRAGWKSIVVSAGGNMTYALEKTGTIHITLPVNSKNPWVMRKNAKLLEDIIRQHKVDIVHARSRAPAWSALWATRRSGTPFITTFHAAYTRGHYFKNLYNSVMTKGEKVIAISDFIARHIVDNYAVDPAKILTIPRGVDIKKFNPAAVSAERIIKMATDWNLPDGVPVVMLPGRLTRLKGHKDLIEALSRLENKNFLALFVGNSEGRESYRRELENLIVARDLAGKVQIKDYCADMAAALMLSDVVVSATTVPEGFGRIAVEAQAMGRPVIATAHGGSLETVLDNQTGWLVKPADIGEMTAALKEALSMTSAKREQVAALARSHMERNFTVEAMCWATMSAYESLLSAPAES